MNAGMLKKLIPILISSFVAWFYCMIYTPLGLIYNTYPGMDSQVMLIATIPGIIAMIGGFAAAAMMAKLGRKNLVILAMILMIVGGLLCRFLGDQGIYFAIIGSALTGFAAGAVPAANYSVMAEIVSENLQDKVYGWSDALCQIGVILASFLGGVFAATGDWTKSFNLYYVAVIALILVLFMYPSEKSMKANSSNLQAETEKGSEATGNEKVPGSVLAMIVIKFVGALFYMGVSLFLSDYIINELQIGTSAIVGTINSLASVVAALGAIFVFVWLKLFKKATTLVCMLIMGVLMFFISMSGSMLVIFALVLIMQLGMTSQHSSYSTVLANATKGKAVGIAAGLFTGATFVGEALGGYVNPWLSNLFFHTSSAGACIRTAAIGCIVVGIISFFIYSKAYKLAFPNGQKVEEK